MSYAFFFVSYVLLWTVFLVGMRLGQRPWPHLISGLDVVLLCLATFRLTELITEEKVSRWLRAPFCELRKVPGSDGEEIEEEVPTGRGLRRVCGEMLLCSWCTGVWIATLLTFFWVAAPSIARLVVIAFAVAAGGLLFQILAKLLDRARKSIPE